MTKTLACIWLSPAERATLEGLVSGRNTPQKLVWRARIVLLSADGIGTMTIVRLVGKSKVTVWRWQERYLAKGIAGLRRDATRPGRKPPLSAEVIERVVHKTLHETPEAATHWSIRKMARAVGLSYTSVQRIWKAHGLKPHLVKTFKLSNDEHFVEKVRDIVGLYLDPPDKALVLSVDEKSQIQALDRTQPGLPIKKGRAGTMTHDYDSAALTCTDDIVRTRSTNIATGKVIGDNYALHEAAPPSGIRLLLPGRTLPCDQPSRRIDAETPRKLDLHLIADNATPPTSIPRSRRGWQNILASICLHSRHPPPGSARSNASDLRPDHQRSNRQEAPRPGRLAAWETKTGFKSVAELETAIQDIPRRTGQCRSIKPFVWTASATAILEKVSSWATAR